MAIHVRLEVVGAPLRARLRARMQGEPPPSALCRGLFGNLRGTGSGGSLHCSSDGGDGTYYALDTGRLDARGEAPVVRLSVDGRRAEQVAPSFGEYLLEAVKAVIS